MSAELHILQNGVPRSGNVWLFNQVRECLLAAGQPVHQTIDCDPVAQVLRERELVVRQVAESDFISITPLQHFYTILDAYRWPIEDLDAYIAASSQVASHSPWSSASLDVYRRFSHVLYVIRDPRDMAVSMARFACLPFNRLHRPHPFDTPKQYLQHKLAEMIQGWVAHVQSHLAHLSDYGGHVLFYEKMVANPVDELRLLAAYLGLRLADGALQQIAGATDIDAIKQQQPEHTHCGGWGGWVGHLTRAQIHAVERGAGPLLAQLGYPLDAEQAANWQASGLRGV